MNSLEYLTLQQAEKFLEDAGEFYPFGTVLDKKGNAVPVGFYDDKIKDPQKITEILKKYFIKDLKKGEITEAIIGVNVTINENGQKRDALLMLEWSPEGQWKHKYFPYKLKGEKIKWLEAF